MTGMPGWCSVVSYLCLVSVSSLCALCGWLFRVQSGFWDWEGALRCVGVMDQCVFCGKHCVVELVWI